MTKQTRRLVRSWKPVYSQPRGATLIFFYAGTTPSGGAIFYHQHHGDDLPHLHLSKAPAGHEHRNHGDHHHNHDHHEHDEPGHWHFAAAACGIVSLLVLALCWISFLVSDEVNPARPIATKQWARPPPL